MNASHEVISIGPGEPDEFKHMLDEFHEELGALKTHRNWLVAIMIVSLNFLIPTMLRDSAYYATLKAIGELGMGVLVLAPIVSAIWLVVDYKAIRQLTHLISRWEKSLHALYSIRYFAAHGTSESYLYDSKKKDRWIKT